MIKLDLYILLWGGQFMGEGSCGYPKAVIRREQKGTPPGSATPECSDAPLPEQREIGSSCKMIAAHFHGQEQAQIALSSVITAGGAIWEHSIIERPLLEQDFFAPVFLRFRPALEQSQDTHQMCPFGLASGELFGAALRLVQKSYLIRT